MPDMVIPAADPQQYGDGAPIGDSDHGTFLECDAFEGVNIWGPPSGDSRRTARPVEIPRAQDTEGK